jgi:hypothetical protein
MTGVAGREKKRAEERLRAFGAAKRVKAFKKCHDNESDLGIGESGDDDDTDEMDGELVMEI